LKTGGLNKDVRVKAGDSLVVGVATDDPAGISKILVQCCQFSMSTSNWVKVAVGEVVIPPEQQFDQTSFDVRVRIPDNAAIGKWGVQLIEFTNVRGGKTVFYRGQSKFDDIKFEVVAPSRREDRPLQLTSVSVSRLRTGAL
ncbi:MAG: hypothetical protein ACREDR_32380, partial [Blastocatellia bacterium]